MTDKIRTFDTGATRSNDDERLDYEGFLSPLVLERYAQYMHKHRKQADGTLRDSDNWQKGIPIREYMKSKWRHFMVTWKLYRAVKRITDNHPDDIDIIEVERQASLPIIESLCAELFNTIGMLHELLIKLK